MATKIVLDAGHGGFDNGASYNGRTEKDDNLKLTLAVGNILKGNGYDVVYTRTEDVYNTPGEKARIANQSGADYFVSFHRNASPLNNQYSGVETLVFDDNGVKAEMARNINENLSEVGFANLGVKERQNLIVLNSTDIPALLVETGFLNTDQDNTLFDTQFDNIAKAIADGIMETVQNVKNAPVNQIPEQKIYRVQIGLYNTFLQAQYALNEAVEKGFAGEVIPWKQYYSVRMGAFDTIDQARAYEKELQKAGYDTLLVL